MPHCWYGATSDDRHSFTLLLEDLADARPGVQADGCTLGQASAAVSNLAGLHAPRWNDPTLLHEGFLAPADTAVAAFLGEMVVLAAEEFIERYSSELRGDDKATLRDAARATAVWQLARPEPYSIVHGDYRLDNLMFALQGEQVYALDWQTVVLGPPLRDLAYFLGTSLEIDDRRNHQEKLVAQYYSQILARGVANYSFEHCYDDYRLGQLQGPLITILGCMYATANRSAQADSMFLAMATRSCAAIRDLGSIELL